MEGESEGLREGSLLHDDGTDGLRVKCYFFDVEVLAMRYWNELVGQKIAVGNTNWVRCASLLDWTLRYFGREGGMRLRNEWERACLAYGCTGSDALRGFCFG